MSWWRRQRVALIALPFIVVASVAASSMYLQEFWWNRGFHDAAPVSARGVASVSDEYDDGYQSYPIRAEVRLESAERISQIPGAYQPMELPEGAVLWEVRLAWKADPDTVLTGCQVALHDTDGSIYLSGRGSFDAGAPLPVQSCLPDETPGPRIQVGTVAPPALEEGEGPRPASWSTRVYVLTPEDARPDEVRIWWFLPTYAALPLG